MCIASALIRAKALSLPILRFTLYIPQTILPTIREDGSACGFLFGTAIYLYTGTFIVNPKYHKKTSCSPKIVFPILGFPKVFSAMIHHSCVILSILRSDPGRSIFRMRFALHSMPNYPFLHQACFFPLLPQHKAVRVCPHTHGSLQFVQDV